MVVFWMTWAKWKYIAWYQWKVSEEKLHMHARATGASGKLVEIFAQHDNEEANRGPLEITNLSCRWIRRAKWLFKQTQSNHCLIRLVISAGNANELIRELFAKSVACSPWTKRVWLRSSVKNGSRFVGVKGIIKARAQVWLGDLMCQIVVMMKNEWLSFHQALMDEFCWEPKGS